MNFDSGYPRSTLTAKNHGDISFDVHAIVATLFCENDDPINKTCINHKNRDLEDCNFINLEWCTYIYLNNYVRNFKNKKNKIL